MTFVALQIAYFMGFKKVVIVGMDHLGYQGAPGQQTPRNLNRFDHLLTATLEQSRLRKFRTLLHHGARSL